MSTPEETTASSEGKTELNESATEAAGTKESTRSEAIEGRTRKLTAYGQVYQNALERELMRTGYRRDLVLRNGSVAPLTSQI